MGNLKTLHKTRKINTLNTVFESQWRRARNR